MLQVMIQLKVGLLSSLAPPARRSDFNSGLMVWWSRFTVYTVLEIVTNHDKQNEDDYSCKFIVILCAVGNFKTNWSGRRRIF